VHRDYIRIASVLSRCIQRAFWVATANDRMALKADEILKIFRHSIYVVHGSIKINHLSAGVASGNVAFAKAYESNFLLTMESERRDKMKYVQMLGQALFVAAANGSMSCVGAILDIEADQTPKPNSAVGDQPGKRLGGISLGNWGFLSQEYKDIPLEYFQVALILACRNGSSDLVAMFLEIGSILKPIRESFLNRPSNGSTGTTDMSTGITASMAAAMSDNRELVWSLVAAGADLTDVDGSRNTALEYVKSDAVWELLVRSNNESSRTLLSQSG
jgi:ankyrin repeat protein